MTLPRGGVLNILVSSALGAGLLADPVAEAIDVRGDPACLTEEAVERDVRAWLDGRSLRGLRFTVFEEPGAFGFQVWEGQRQVATRRFEQRPDTCEKLRKVVSLAVALTADPRAGTPLRIQLTDPRSPPDPAALRGPPAPVPSTSDTPPQAPPAATEPPPPLREPRPRALLVGGFQITGTSSPAPGFGAGATLDWHLRRLGTNATVDLAYAPPFELTPEEPGVSAHAQQVTASASLRGCAGDQLGRRWLLRGCLGWGGGVVVSQGVDIMRSRRTTAPWVVSTAGLRAFLALTRSTLLGFGAELVGAVVRPTLKTTDPTGAISARRETPPVGVNVHIGLSWGRNPWGPDRNSEPRT